MPKDLSRLIKRIQKDLKGAARVSNLADVKTPFHIKRPTGILSMDIALKGGFTAGGVHQIHGPDGVGKDYLTNLMMAENQRLYGEDSCIFWMSFGYQPDRTFMRFSGVDVAYTDNDLISLGYPPDGLEDIAEGIRGINTGNLLFVDLDPEVVLDKPAETMLDVILQFIGSNEFQLGIVNELGSGQTRHNVVKQLGEDPRIASWAGLMTQFLQKMYTEIRVPQDNGDPNETTIMMLNPVRANLNAMSAKFRPTVQGGGFALKHAKATDVHLRPLGAIRKGTNQVGKKIGWKIAKGKHGISEGANGMYEFLFDGGVDLVLDLANVAKAYKIVRNRGRHYYILDREEPISGGFEAVVPIIRESRQLQDEIRVAVMEAIRDGKA
jgi:RecA/RadA recombinase